MRTVDVERLREIKTLPSLIKFLREELDWPIEADEIDDLTFDYAPEELGLNEKHAAQIKEIKQLRPLDSRQPWGIFWINFEKKRLPMVVLRRILGNLIIKRRAGARKADRPSWHLNDLLFISSYGEEEHREISFAHFAEDPDTDELPVLRVLGWDDQNSIMHLDRVANQLHSHFRWPDNSEDLDAWRRRWSDAFTDRYGEAIHSADELIPRLAQLAANIRGRVRDVLDAETNRGPMRRLLTAVQTLLIHDMDENAFADMYAQTVAYGLLSARFSRPADINAQNLVQLTAVSNPFLENLLENLFRLNRGKFHFDVDEVGINEVLNLLRNTNIDAIKAAFSDKNPAEDPVIHFYEGFLKQYDPRQRIQRGIFFTPRPVVSYIVRSVHELLQTEFGLEDGLASTVTWSDMKKRFADLKIPEGTQPDDPFVCILDPATGTGTFLFECIEIIERTMKDKWSRKLDKNKWNDPEIIRLWQEYVPKHLLPRLYGYELMMAPYAIAHLKLALKLGETGYQFREGNRLHIYLTNSLEEPSDRGQQALAGFFPVLADEARAVNAVKHHKRFTVVIGNPPYAIHSGNLTTAARSIVERYRHYANAVIRERGALQFEKNLQNDYVKFFRLTELLVTVSSLGVVGFITSHAFLSNRTLRGMRESLHETFHLLSCLNLHGNSASGEAAALSVNDKNVFDITEGVSISLLVRTSEPRDKVLKYADLAGTREHKYAWLGTHSESDTTWLSVCLSQPNIVFKPTGDSQSGFDDGVALDAIFKQRSAGVITARDDFATDESRSTLVSRVEAFTKSRLSGAHLRAEFGIKDKKGWDVDVAQRQARQDMPFREKVYDYCYRPFDSRFIAYNRGIVWGMAYPTLKHTLGRQNFVLIGMQQYQYDVPNYCYAFVSRGLTDSRIFVSKTGVAILFPLYLYPAESEPTLHSGAAVNLSQAFTQKVLTATGLTWIPVGVGDLLDSGTTGPEAIFHYIYALLHSPEYRKRFAEPLRTSFPRVFVPGTLDFFREIDRLGGELVALHLMESPNLNKPITKWQGATPSSEIEKVIYSDKTVWIDKVQSEGFRGVPEAVWNFHIGGYQVCEKWLKDRKGRQLSPEDITHYQKIVVALSETIRIMAEIDKVIEKHGGWPGAFAN